MYRVVAWVLVAVLMFAGAAPGIARDLDTAIDITGPQQVTVAAGPPTALWLVPSRTGLYDVSLSAPGALRLHAFPSQDGRNADGVKPRVLLNAESIVSGPGFTSLLLPAGRPYLLLVRPLSGDAVLDVRLRAEAGAVRTGEAAVPGGTGWSALYRLDAPVKLRWPAAPGVLHIEAIAEPRAAATARLDRRIIPPGGLFPLELHKDTTLALSAKVPAGPAPLMLLRARPAGVTLDEREENDSTPNTLDIDTGARAALLPGKDTDRFAFTLESAQHRGLRVEAATRWAGFSARLERAATRGKGTVLASRTARGGTLDFGPLSLEPGAYQLVVTRADDAPEPVEYRITLPQAAAPGAGFEVEPNDTAAGATPLAAPGALRGMLAADDIDSVRFSITAADRLWRLIGLRGAARLLLRDGNNALIADVRASGGRVMLDNLGLQPGPYSAELRGEGAYALRLMDLGPAPAGFEREPNDTAGQEMRILPSGALGGTFGQYHDVERIGFRLDGESPVSLTITPPGDGAMTAWLEHDGRAWGQPARFVTGDGPYRYHADLPPGTYMLQLRADDAAAKGRWAVRLERRGDNPGGEPDTTPERFRAMPRDGAMPGTVGAFDGTDLLHVALPEGSGRMIIGCLGTPGMDPAWSLRSYGDGKRLAHGGFAPGIVDYDPALGGAAQLTIKGGGAEAPYRCFQRFPPGPGPAPTDTAEQDAPVPLSPGAALSGRLEDRKDRDIILLDLPEGAAGVLRCRFDGGPPPRNIGRWAGVETVRQPLDEATHVFRRKRGEDALITLSGQSVRAHPAAWSCALFGEDDLPALSGMGPVAAFDPMLRAKPGSAPPVAPPVQLAPGRPDWLPDAAPGGDAPLAITVEGLDAPLAAYSRAGQHLAVAARVTNTGDGPLDVAIDARMLAEGWRVEGTPVERSLTPGESTQVALTLAAPPMLSPSLAPALAVRARAAGRGASAVVDIPLALDAPARGPFTHWSAPGALRGGLNVLDHAQGARLIARDGKPVPAAKADDFAALHDGLAPHAALRGVFRHEAVFRLAAAAPLAGAVFHLRAANPRADWPEGYEIALSQDGEAWETAAQGRLSASAAPQYVVFGAPRTAAFLRLRVPGCRAGPACRSVVINDIGAIAEPGWRFGEPLDIARPALGGHVVWATEDLGGAWNIGLLTDETRPRKYREVDDRWGDTVEAAIGFHRNRAARVGRIEWTGLANDGPRLGGAAVFASLESPSGPWVRIGDLPAPPEGALRSALDLPEPVWARYLRLRFARDAAAARAGPDRIAVFEAPDGPSVTGLWEDDSPRAGYEFTHDILPGAAPAPAGGPDADRAVPLPMDTPVTSSVLLERNEDWWRIDIPGGAPRTLTLDFGGAARRDFSFTLLDEAGDDVAVREVTPGVFEATPGPGAHSLRVWEPPRNVVIAWDTSGSVAHYIARTLAAVRLWARSLQPGRDALQLLPFGVGEPMLPAWAEEPGDVIPHLAVLPTMASSDSEGAMRLAATALLEREGARGIVIITDAETSVDHGLWEVAHRAAPRVVALSIDSDGRENVTAMMDWAAINGGLFHRVVGVMGLADGMDMAASLFRAPKPYRLTAALTQQEEPEGEAELVILVGNEPGAMAGGAVEIILDASGSMLKRLDGRRRIAIAHDALSGLVRDVLPEGAPVAFRAFGLEKDACRSELMLPLGPLDRAAAERAVRAVPAINLARTAIAKSLLAVRSDLAGAAPPRVVVLVTDGEETCDGDVEAAIRSLREGGFDVRVNIVGFAIDDAALRETFASWAQAGGGAYFDADSAAALGTAIAGAVAPRFVVIRERFDGTEERIGLTAPGAPLIVPAGRLRVEPAGAAGGEPLRLDAADGARIMLRYDAAAGLSLP